MHKSVPRSISFWEKSYFENTDWLIVGAGLVGLQCATEIKNTYPNKRVVVIDQQVMGNAASLKNAGFACFGSAGELLEEIKRSGEDEAFALYLHRFYGIQKLIQKFGGENIGFESTGGYEVFTHKENTKLEEILDKLPELNQSLRGYLKNQPYSLNQAAVLKNTDFNQDIFTCKSVNDTGMKVCETAIYARAEGPIQTHRLYRAVRLAAEQSGVEIYESIRVTNYEDTVGGVLVYSDDGRQLKTERMLLCTNGFSRTIDPEIPVIPARGQIFVTEPLPWQPLNGIYHADDGYLYFRNLGDRILIGGGRNQAFEEESTTEMANTSSIREYIRSYMEDTVLPTRKLHGGVNFEFEWSGIMGMGDQRTPIIEAESSRVYKAVRMGGMGVALSAWVAEKILQLIIDNDGK